MAPIINTMEELRNYLSTTTYDITFILLKNTFNTKLNFVENLISAQHRDLIQNPLNGVKYTLTYEYLTITSVEILNFYLTNITTMIPYLVTYKKKYITRNPWWFPCKQTDPNGPIDDVKVFILYSLKS